MGVAWRPELTTKQSVLDYYTSSEIVRYKVYAGTSPIHTAIRWSYDGSDMNEGYRQLEGALDGLIANPMNINTYVLQLVCSDKTIKLSERKNGKAEPDVRNITFQLNFAQSSYAGGQQMGGVPPQLIDALTRIAETQNLIVSKMNAQLEAPELEEDDGEVSGIEQNPVMAALVGLLNNPRIQNVIIDKVAGFLTPGKPAPVATMAGSEDEEAAKIRKAIEILKAYTQTLGDDLLKLADVAKNDTAQFNMLLQVLRSSK